MQNGPKPGEYELEKMANREAEMAALSGKAEIIISKHRHGPTGSVELHFYGRTPVFPIPPRNGMGAIAIEAKFRNYVVYKL